MMYIIIVFTDEDNIEYDHSGIIHDVKQSSSGYTFYLDTYDDSFRCFYTEKPEKMKYYSVKGSFSDDGTIFFVSLMRNNDDPPEDG